MKFSQKKIDEIIDRYKKININTAFLPFADNSWELLRIADKNAYSVYIQYPEPKNVNMAVVTSPEYINSLLPEAMEEIEKTETFLFLFMALMEEIEKKFGHLLKAFEYGAPPHGGIAIGLDRLLMILLNEKSIREVIAFPKSGDSRDLTMDAPTQVSNEQLKDLKIKVTS